MLRLVDGMPLYVTLSSGEFNFIAYIFILWHNISKKFLLERRISK